jgi:hypothetical protein
MPTSPHFTGSIWFVTLVALLVSLGAQVFIGALTPVTALDWLDNESRQGPVVLIAGETSFWRGDALIRGVSFGLGALIACLLANSLSWYLISTLVVISALSTVFAQFPRPATPAQLALWAVAAPIATFAVSVLVRTRRGDA